MNITSILKKLAQGEVITAAEKAFLLNNKDILNAEQLAAVEKSEVAAEEIETESLKTLIENAIAEKMNSFSDQLAAKFLDGAAASRKRAIDTGAATKTADSETRNFMKALFSGDHAALKDISGLSASAGGYLIPEELRAELLRVAEGQYGLARRDFRYLPFSGPGNDRQIPALATSVSVSWTDERGAKQSTAPTFDVVHQTLKKLAAIVPMTEEIIEDSSINLTALVAELFAEAVAKEEDLQFFNGTGAPWTGILNNGSVNRVEISSGAVTANSVVAEDLLAMIDATPSGALDGAKFYMHRTIFSLIRKLRADGATGDFIVQNPATAGSGPATLWGYPVELSDAFPTLSSVTADEPFVLFGNLKKAAIFGDKQQLRVKLLDQATVNDTTNAGTVNLAQRDMVAIRIVERVGYVLALPTAVTVLHTDQS